MRILPGALGVLLLLVLLTWLLLRGIDTNASAYALTLKAFDDFALAEASLHRDVLQARVGLIRNYDTLVQATEAIKDAVARLRFYAQSEGLDTRPVDCLAAAVAQQEELTERFKSTNAILQNSLSYVSLLSTGLMFNAEDARVLPDPARSVPPVRRRAALAAAILNLTRDTSSDAINVLHKRIDQFAAQAPTVGPDVEAAQALIVHARLLSDLLPAIDATLKALFALPSKQPLKETRALFADHRAVIEAAVQRSRLLLYLVSLLLLVILVNLGLRLRARAIALRRRAAFEHVIAENSTRLINSSPAETEVRLQQVLRELGHALGLIRGYVVLAETPVRAYAWCAEGMTYPAEWPDRALELSKRLGATGPDIVTIPDAAVLPTGDIKDTLSSAGIRGWACIPLTQPGHLRGIVGFDTLDALQPGWEKVFSLPVMRLAGDAVFNAIERERLDRERARLATRLERAQRMQVIGSLASGIAHNFNNVIGAILGFSEMVEPHLVAGTNAAQHIDEIRQAAERGRDLIDNILCFGRQRDALAQPVQVRNLFEEAASLLRASLPSGIELVIQDVPTEITVSGAPVELQQIILNLCTNAAQAMEGNGRIRVTAEQKDILDIVLLSHGKLMPGRYVCLAVTDTGHGFDEDVARRLFEPFFTTRSAGTGLGLATVHEIVRDSGGAMNVQSKPGSGSRFEAWLPTTAAGTIAVAEPASLPLGHGEAVLVFESERERLLRDEEMLAALGYEPIGFQRPADALAACRSGPNRFDIILVSHTLQTDRGIDLVHALHTIAPRQPLLLAVPSTIDISVNALADAGIFEVLRRPLSATELAAALARCLRSTGTLRP
jgi:signal transduction histidine kinase